MATHCFTCIYKKILGDDLNLKGIIKEEYKGLVKKLFYIYLTPLKPLSVCPLVQQNHLWSRRALALRRDIFILT